MRMEELLLDRPAPEAETDAAAVLHRGWLALSPEQRRDFSARIGGPLASVPGLAELAAVARTQLEGARAATGPAGTVVLDGETLKLDTALHSVEDVLLKVIETVVAISKNAMRMVYALDDVVRDVQGAEQCVGQIDVINTQTRYLALNAAIEANRSGEAGAAFRVIAREIKDLSRATEETSRQVRDRIGSIAAGVETGHKVLQEIASLDMSEHILARARLTALVTGLLAQQRTLDAALEENADGAAEVTRMVDQLIASST